VVSAIATVDDIVPATHVREQGVAGVVVHHVVRRTPLEIDVGIGHLGGRNVHRLVVGRDADARGGRVDFRVPATGGGDLGGVVVRGDAEVRVAPGDRATGVEAKGVQRRG